MFYWLIKENLQVLKVICGWRNDKKKTEQNRHIHTKLYSTSHFSVIIYLDIQICTIEQKKEYENLSAVRIATWTIRHHEKITHFIWIICMCTNGFFNSVYRSQALYNILKIWCDLWKQTLFTQIKNIY